MSSLLEHRTLMLYLSALLILVGAAVFIPGASAAIVPAVIGVAGIALLTHLVAKNTHGPYKRRLMFWSYLSFGLHLAIGVAIVYGFEAVHYFGPDALGFHQDAVNIYRHWEGLGGFPQLSPGKEGFPYLLAAADSLVGTYAISGLILNAAMAGSLVPLVSETTRRLVGADNARWVPPLMCFIPGFLVWPAQLLREAGVLFLMALVIHCVVSLTQNTKATGLLGLIPVLSVVLALLFTFRASTAAIIALAAFAMLWLCHPKRLVGLAFSGATIVLFAAAVFGLGIGQGGVSYVTGADVESVSDLKQSVSEDADSGFADRPGTITRLPGDLLRVVLGPFPWELSGLRQLPALGSAIVLWLLAPFMISGFWVVFRPRTFSLDWQHLNLLFLVLAAGALTGVLALGVGNYGLLIRLRPQVLLLLIPFVAIGIAAAWRRRFQPDEPQSTIGRSTGTGLSVDNHSYQGDRLAPTVR